MVDPNRKINNLTDEHVKFIEECEEEFKDRFTENDEEFREICKRGLKNPPIVESWMNNRRYAGGRNDNDDGNKRHDNYSSRGRGRGFYRYHNHRPYERQGNYNPNRNHDSDNNRDRYRDRQDNDDRNNDRNRYDSRDSDSKIEKGNRDTDSHRGLKREHYPDDSSCKRPSFNQ